MEGRVVFLIFTIGFGVAWRPLGKGDSCMRKLPGNLLIVIVATVLVAVAPAAAQDAPYTAPRLAGSENPDLNGVWQALNTANWDLRPHAAAPSAFPTLWPLGVMS